MRVAFLLSIFVSLAIAVPQVAEAKACKDRGKSPAVMVQGKTPLRRGPGLNYPVASFLDQGGCFAFSEVSMDKEWILVDANGQLGWVPASRLSKESREQILATEVKSAPVGSGQRRGYARVVRQSLLLERPAEGAPPKRVAPEGLEVLPLSATLDGAWTQVRDERAQVGWMLTRDLDGEALAEVPRTDSGVGEGVVQNAPPEPGPPMVGPPEPPGVGAAAPEGPAVVGERPAARTELGVRASLFGAALLPVHSLDSNGEGVTRRYDVSAFAPGMAAELQLSELGPLSLRGAYMLGLLRGIAPEGEPDRVVGGTQHDAFVRLGVPLVAGPVLLTPELGYAFAMLDIDSFLPPQRLVTFVSSITQAGTVGARAQMAAAEGFWLEAEASFLAGVTAEGPQTLGKSSLTLGGSAAVGAEIGLADGVALAFRYVFQLRSTGYTGAGKLDPTITEATLSSLNHGLLAGITFSL